MEQNKFYQIKNVTEHEYTLVGCDGSVIIRPIQDVDKSASVFTIQDAKDGDVLCCESGWTCIFKTLVNDETFSSYCFMDKTKWFCGTGSECHTLNKEFTKAYSGEIKPATKEQRDFLFQKIKEAGYEWDAEKKELNKIEDEPENYKQQVVSEMTDLVEDYIEQKPAWSEEDNYNLQCMIAKVTSDIQNGNIGRNNELIDWLKSLKDRVQPKQEWSEEDEERIKNIFSVLDVQVCWDGATGEKKNPYQKEIEWLKPLKDRVQPKQEWCKEDEQIILSIEQVMNCASLLNIVPEKIDKIKSWLKSLKQRLGGEK